MQRYGTTAVLALGILTGLASRALAQAPAAAEDPLATEPPAGEATTDAYAGYPFSAVLRPMTLPQAAVRLEADVGSFRAVNAMATGLDNVAFFTIGGAIGVTDQLELGISANRLGAYTWRYSTLPPGNGVPMQALPQGAIALALTPDVDFGDVPVYARVQLIGDDKVQLGADLAVVIPVESDLQLQFGVPIRMFVGPHATFDFGAQMRVVFHDDMDGGTSFTVAMPVRGLYQLLPFMYLSVQSGFEISDNGLDSFALPLWAELGFTLGRDRTQPYADLVATMGWPAILVGTSNDRSIQDVWSLSVGVRAYLQP